MRFNLQGPLQDATADSAKSMTMHTNPHAGSDAQVGAESGSTPTGSEISALLDLVISGSESIDTCTESFAGPSPAQPTPPFMLESEAGLHDGVPLPSSTLSYNPTCSLGQVCDFALTNTEAIQPRDAFILEKMLQNDVQPAQFMPIPWSEPELPVYYPERQILEFSTTGGVPISDTNAMWLQDLDPFGTSSYTTTLPATASPLRQQAKPKSGRSRRCSVPGCEKSSQSRGRCIRHGGGKRCSIEGCVRGAQATGRCKAHGGGVRCKVEGCGKGSQGSGLCRTHGGGKLCEFPGCKKGTQRGGKCSTHGGARICAVDGCTRVDRGGGRCGRHKLPKVKSEARTLV